MSDSDDTNVLLMIPPDFFIAETGSEHSDLISFTSSINIQGLNSFNPNISIYNNANTELQQIDREIWKLEKDYKTNSNLTSKIDYRNDFQSFDHNVFKPSTRDMNTSSPKIYHSTPRNQHNDAANCHFLDLKDLSTPLVARYDDKFLKEIDNFLQENPQNLFTNSVVNKDLYSLPNPVHTSANEALKKHNNMLNKEKTMYTNYETNRLNLASGDKYEGPIYDQDKYFNLDNTQRSQNKPLISLSDIWGPEGQTETLTLQEERLRRQHCEQTIHVLQGKLLEYQQKISVAMKIDKTKDEALTRLHDTHSSLAARINQLEFTISEIKLSAKDEKENLLCENNELKEKNNLFEHELCQAMGMAKKFQEQNEVLEIKIENLTRSTNEIRDIHRKQLEDLEIRLSNTNRNDELLNTELTKYKTLNKKLQADYEKAHKSGIEYKKQFEEAQNEAEIVKQQKSNTYEKFREEKNRADMLDKQKKSLQQAIDSLNNKEKTLLKELEMQRISLKSYYQTQLEQVVGQKLKEFQKQIDSVEETLKSEAKDRERLIAERAIKQMELIIQKNDQELALMNEKHSEEIELYRLQLANASATINQLHEKLNAYKSKRADIAERLQNVMETQWQKALEIITSPNTQDEYKPNNKQLKAIDATKLDRDKADGVAGLYQNKAENEIFETPTSSRNRKQKYSENSADKLHAYIDMLLQKSPRDLDNLDEILNMAKNSNEAKTENCISRRDTPFKAPWK